MDRRQFIRSVFQAAVVFGSLPVLDLMSVPALAANPPRVSQRKGQNIAQLVEDTLDALGGMGNFVKNRRQGGRQAEYRLGPNSGTGSKHSSGSRQGRD